MKNYWGVYFTICSLFFILFTQSACHIQKRRYSKGFYVNKGLHQKTFINNKIDYQRKPKVNPNITEISKDLSIVAANNSIEIIDNAILINDKVHPNEKEKLIFTIDTISKKQDKNVVQKNSQSVKPRMELFSKLALIAILINMAIIIAIPVLVVFFTASELVIALIILSLFAPAFSFILALEGKFNTDNQPEKYKWPRIAEIIIIIAFWMFILSLFYLFILAFTAGVSASGW